MTGSNEASNVVLAATDGSSTAQVAVEAAIQIARGRHMEIRGLSVVSGALMMNPYANYQREFTEGREPSSHDRLLESLKHRGAAALKWMEARCQVESIPVSTELMFGGVPETVLRQANGAEMLALGRRGHGHHDDAHHLGSQFQAIARRAHRPTVVGGDVVRQLSCLLVAYDGKEGARRALDWAAGFCREPPCRLIVLVVQETETDRAAEWLADARSRIAADGLDGCEFVQRAGRAASQIAAVADDSQVDLIAMGRYSHSALRGMLGGSTVDRVLRRTPLTTLVF